MYTISKGPSQIVAKTRRGLAQKLELADTIRGMTRKNSDPDEMDWSGSLSPPRPVFQTANLTSNKRNGHSSSHQHRHHHHHHQQSQQQPEILTRSQEELIKYVYERWQRVNRELKTSTVPTTEGTVTYYKDASPNPALQDFEPFDLEGWWGRRLYHTLTQSS